MKHDEAELQKQVVRFLRLKKLLFICNPHANLHLPAAIGKRMKVQGYEKGQPDILILEPRINYKGMALELKVYNNKVTAYQADFLSKLKDRGYHATYVPNNKTVVEAYRWVVNAVSLYLKLKKE